MSTPKPENTELLVWLDVESTSLNPYVGSRLLQVAAIVTDLDYNELEGEYMSKVYFSAEDAAALRESADPYVQNMHDSTNLWNTLPEGKPLAVISDEVLEFLKARGVTERNARLGGNSITLDRNHLEVELPEVYNFLHYRSLDMSSVAYFLHNGFGLPYYEKQNTHDALDDIRESIAEARYYRDSLKRLIPND